MKVDDNDNIIIYLNKNYLENKDKEEIKTIILKIKDIFKIDLEGYLNIDIYKDKYYGIIIEIEKDNYLDYFKSDLEMNIRIIEDIFLYEIDDLSNIDLKSIKIYKDKDKIYIKPKENIIMSIIEKSNIIYGEKAQKIIKKNMEVIL